MSGKPFSVESRLKKGYDIEQVNEFFNDARKALDAGAAPRAYPASKIRYAAFDMVRGGYVTKEVDAALDRLENAIVKRARANAVAENGQDAWNAEIADKATTLYPRMLRPEGSRFSHPRGKGYKIEEVDNFVDVLAAFFDEGQPVTANDVRRVTFAPARGEKAYSEGVVDAYLARAIEILLAVE